MATIKIAVINEYQGLTDADVEPVVKALEIQVKRHVAPVWGVDADLTFYKAGTIPPPDAWQLVILDNADQAGVLGYHDLTQTGYPLGEVFAGTDLRYGAAWSATASHELLEMLVDPDIDLCAFVQEADGTSTLYAYEVCDACEADQFGYPIKVGSHDILVSDFVYPAWFETFHPTGAQYDYCKFIKKPFELLLNGYISVFDIGTGGGWTQKKNEDTRQQFKMRASVGTRRERRRTPRDQWLPSTAPMRSAATSAPIAPSHTHTPSSPHKIIP
jgi:hypothetical protein